MIEAAADLFWILLYAMGALLVLGIGVLFTVETLKQIAKTTIFPFRKTARKFLFSEP